MSKALLITGATGKQGGAVIDSLLSLPQASQYTILGVTRNTESASAKKLASKSPLIKIIQGDFADVPALFQSATAALSSASLYGVFSVQVPGGKGQSPETEEKYGKQLVDESLKQGVKHFVYTSVDRGGDEKSWENQTEVPHFKSKYKVEHHLKDKSEGVNMTWTILRPVAFMDNIQPTFSTKVFLAAWRNKLEQKPLQLISTRDIGYMGAQALADPEKYRDQAIGLAGDEINYDQVQERFKERTGSEYPATFGFLGSALLAGVKEFGLMMNWFKAEGYGVDIRRLRQLHPGLEDFGAYIDKSCFPKNK